MLLEQTLSQLSARLVPFFRVNHPTRGEILGPFAKLPASPVRTLVLDVAATLHAADAKDDLGGAVEGAVRAQEREYWGAIRS